MASDEDKDVLMFICLFLRNLLKSYSRHELTIEIKKNKGFFTATIRVNTFQKVVGYTDEPYMFRVYPEYVVFCMTICKTPEGVVMFIPWKDYTRDLYVCLPSFSEV